MTRRRRRRPSTPDARSGNADEDRPAEGPVEIPVDDATEAEGATAAEGRPPEAQDAETRVRGLEDRLKRLQAEFVNDTKRIARQAEEGRKYAVEGLVVDLLPVLDALHSARQGLSAEEVAPERDAPGATVEAVREGLDLVEKELLKVLERHGVEPIEASDSSFDPALHEALFVVDHPDREPNTVAQVLRPGFTLRGRVVRPAHVSVTRAAPVAQEETAETEGDAGAGDE